MRFVEACAYVHVILFDCPRVLFFLRIATPDCSAAHAGVAAVIPRSAACWDGRMDLHRRLLYFGAEPSSAKYTMLAVLGHSSCSAGGYVGLNV